MTNRPPKPGVAVVLPPEPKVVFASPTSVTPPANVCQHERTEVYDAPRPDGVVLEIWRCLDCGAHQVTPKGE